MSWAWAASHFFAASSARSSVANSSWADSQASISSMLHPAMSGTLLPVHADHERPEMDGPRLGHRSSIRMEACGPEEQERDASKTHLEGAFDLLFHSTLPSVMILIPHPWQMSFAKPPMP